MHRGGSETVSGAKLQNFTAKPITVQAVRITKENLTVLSHLYDLHLAKDTAALNKFGLNDDYSFPEYIGLRVLDQSNRKTALIGDWLVREKPGNRFVSYTNAAFKLRFQEIG